MTDRGTGRDNVDPRVFHTTCPHCGAPVNKKPIAGIPPLCTACGKAVPPRIVKDPRAMPDDERRDTPQ